MNEQTLSHPAALSSVLLLFIYWLLKKLMYSTCGSKTGWVQSPKRRLWWQEALATGFKCALQDTV